MEYSNFTIYVDESGDHSLESINPEYPLFVLAFCMAEKADYRAQIAPEMAGFKHRWFGHEAVILHDHEIRKEKGDFKFLFDRDARNQPRDAPVDRRSRRLQATRQAPRCAVPRLMCDHNGAHPSGALNASKSASGRFVRSARLPPPSPQSFSG